VRRKILRRLVPVSAPHGKKEKRKKLKRRRGTKKREAKKTTYSVPSFQPADTALQGEKKKEIGHLLEGGGRGEEKRGKKVNGCFLDSIPTKKGKAGRS